MHGNFSCQLWRRGIYWCFYNSNSVYMSFPLVSRTWDFLLVELPTSVSPCSLTSSTFSIPRPVRFLFPTPPCHMEYSSGSVHHPQSLVTLLTSPVTNRTATAFSLTRGCLDYTALYVRNPLRGPIHSPSGKYRASNIVPAPVLFPPHIFRCYIGNTNRYTDMLISLLFYSAPRLSNHGRRNNDISYN